MRAAQAAGRQASAENRGRPRRACAKFARARQSRGGLGVSSRGGMGGWRDGRTESTR
jgi:hypothetical protein